MEEEELEEVSEEVGIKIPGVEDSKKLSKDELKRKVLLQSHSYIPWECGSNRYASQRGMSAFGSIRRNVPKIHSTKSLSDSSDAVIPRWAEAYMKASGKPGVPPFGGPRETVSHVAYPEGNQSELDSQSKSILPKWMRSNPIVEAANSLMARRRGPILEVSSNHKLHRKDLKAEGVIPRLADSRFDPTDLSGTGTGIVGLHRQRQVTQKIVGIDESDLDLSRRSPLVPWQTGPQSHETQSKTGGFLKQRDVATMNYYDRKVYQKPQRRED